LTTFCLATLTLLHGPGLGLAICASCADRLPWIQQACPHCAQPQNFDVPCPRCLKKAPPVDSAWAAFRLEAPVQQAIHSLKYGAGFLQRQLLAELMAQKLGRRWQPLPELIIPVPLYPIRLIRRGYNQVLELALVIKHSLDIGVDAKAAKRIIKTSDQIGLSRAQRQRNLRNAFVVGARVAGKHIALLDDVMTTGATLTELARAARKTGAARIEA
jgi:ComF family protein